MKKTKKDKFDPDKFAYALEIACVEAMKKDLDLNIPLNREELFEMMNTMRNWNKWEFQRYINEIRPFWKMARHMTEQVVMVRMNPRLQWITIMAIEGAGKNKSAFELKNRLITWFGIERSRALVFKDFIPMDDREGAYDDNYDGSTRTTFNLDNIGLCFEDQQAMESAIENNKWNKDMMSI